MTQSRKPRVLLADDEPHIRMLIKTVMRSMNCEVIGEALNGNEAIELFKKEKPDLLMLDINMPLRTGEEALKEIMTEFPDAFVIMLTSVSDLESVENCLSLGASNFIRKDTPIQEMKKIIKETWQASRQ
jgi:two-component system chemotaxis response regulator CheY